MGFEEKRGELHRRLTELIAHLGWKLDLGRKAATLSIAEQQLVELLRGLMRDSRLLILDEPTSSLTFNEVESLFKIVRDLKRKGIGIVSHHTPPQRDFEIADQVLIMRDGVITLNGPVGDFTRDMLVAGLLPPDSEVQSCRRDCPVVDYGHTEPALVVDHLSGYGFSDICLQVYPGEILGLAGVVGAGPHGACNHDIRPRRGKKRQGSPDGPDVTGMSTARCWMRASTMCRRIVS